MKGERAKLSRRNPYYIPAERYYELKHFCRQYYDWKKALNLIDAWHVPPNDISGVLKGNPPSNPTERQALARVYYSGHIDILESCLPEIDPAISVLIKRRDRRRRLRCTASQRLPLLPGTLLRILPPFLLAAQQRTRMTRKIQAPLWTKFTKIDYVKEILLC